MDVKPLTPETWDDFVEVMGAHGGQAGCWCMFYRQTSAVFQANQGEPNRELMRQIVDGGQSPGLIGYRDGRPVGWVAVGPREWHSRLDRSRVTKPLDERPAWAITCFVIPKEHRRSGVATDLMNAAVEHARTRGADLIEAYPVDPAKDSVPDAFSWMGFATMFRSCGFEEVARRSETRPFMRLELGG